MQIRQLAVQYDVQADRLLLRVRSSDDQVFADAQRRSVQLELDAPLATAVRELVAAALRRADWGIDAGTGPTPTEAATATRLLN
jgi:hypothetical protein